MNDNTIHNKTPCFLLNDTNPLITSYCLTFQCIFNYECSVKPCSAKNSMVPLLLTVKSFPGGIVFSVNEGKAPKGGILKGGLLKWGRTSKGGTG